MGMFEFQAVCEGLVWAVGQEYVFVISFTSLEKKI